MSKSNSEKAYPTARSQRRSGIGRLRSAKRFLLLNSGMYGGFTTLAVNKKGSRLNGLKEMNASAD
ncbi:hypothetical protein IT6_07405 [Methylacidiphilum caldifontis]|uniref:hypothetical protein n=1 Tax=Methylacidiphilum caldifontis TaxID=2795386 RepID=UPI001A8E7E16|nr:hypothetical protein [Methylacidiphilum caldifontis]QSR88209.1 hypothetical protein IT6_07405 [Methylacidiphilum caldifontis]